MVNELLTLPRELQEVLALDFIYYFSPTWIFRDARLCREAKWFIESYTHLCSFHEVTIHDTVRICGDSAILMDLTKLYFGELEYWSAVGAHLG